MDTGEALDFCARWLPAWTGNRPDALLDFYAPDAVYSDPACRAGLGGRASLAAHFAKLLARNPEWRWEAVEVFPHPQGFTLKWKAFIPVGTETVTEYGMDIVELRDGLITRNEVYFDRTALLEALRAARRPHYR